MSIINKEQSFSFVINVEVQGTKFFKIYFEESARVVFLYTAKEHHYTSRKKIKLNKYREKPTFEISNEVSGFFFSFIVGSCSARRDIFNCYAK